ncbi:hypothetical protein [Pseudoalteromonas sp. G4]|uniref:hypothetical protein n=1 Tax=Pseudoalteromonas sp. G4 TaxID=2992761 RepID=UPI00237D9334|nr:hypothetical protein [Pseudoalteromonas sp. G4]MDE3272698.1 hypothetical protein [Pseudoalteromonas sp. G4]
MKTKILTLCAALTLIGCNSTQPPAQTSEPYYASEIISIKNNELEQYWQAIPTQVNYKSRPKWLPKSGGGVVLYRTTIDSNGREVARELVQSIPDGWMSEDKLKQMPLSTFKATESNKNKTPVTFVNYFSVALKANSEQVREIMAQYDL